MVSYRLYVHVDKVFYTKVRGRDIIEIPRINQELTTTKYPWNMDKKLKGTMVETLWL